MILEKHQFGATLARLTVQKNIPWLQLSTCSLISLKFIYSEKATKFCEISTLLLTVCTVFSQK